MSIKMYSFSQKIINWYQLHKRDLPWRSTKDAYKIWLSEIILQQTRVAQGLPYYQKFISAFPKIEDLAKASEEEVLKLWQGLGYYSRARNLHETAKQIVVYLEAQFPTNYQELIKLKGIGDYTASAISSFCANENQPVVDGNVYRVLARYFGIPTPINTPKAQREFKELSFELIDEKQAGIYNQSIMEFGALQCVPSNPNCEECPLNDSCVALQTDQIINLPIKKTKLKIRKRYFNYLVLKTINNKTLVNQRKGKGIWQNLYEFPVVETINEINYKGILQQIIFKELVEENNFTLKLLTPKSSIHKLSHQHLYIKFWLLEMDVTNKELITWEQVMQLPFPIVLFRFIEEYLNNQ